MRFVLHIVQAVAIIAYLIYVIVEVRKGKLQGGRRWVAFALAGIFALGLVANIEGW